MIMSSTFTAFEDKFWAHLIPLVEMLTRCDDQGSLLEPVETDLWWITFYRFREEALVNRQAVSELEGNTCFITATKMTAHKDDAPHPLLCQYMERRESQYSRGIMWMCL